MRNSEGKEGRKGGGRKKEILHFPSMYFSRCYLSKTFWEAESTWCTQLRGIKNNAWSATKDRPSISFLPWPQRSYHCAELRGRALPLWTSSSWFKNPVTLPHKDDIFSQNANPELSLKHGLTSEPPGLIQKAIHPLWPTVTPFQKKPWLTSMATRITWKTSQKAKRGKSAQQLELVLQLVLAAELVTKSTSDASYIQIHIQIKT